MTLSFTVKFQERYRDSKERTADLTRIVRGEFPLFSSKKYFINSIFQDGYFRMDLPSHFQNLKTFPAPTFHKLQDRDPKNHNDDFWLQCLTIIFGIDINVMRLSIESNERRARGQVPILWAPVPLSSWRKTSKGTGAHIMGTCPPILLASSE